MVWYDFIPTVQKQARDMASTISKGYDWLTETRMRQDKEREAQERARAELMQEQARCESRARLRGSQRQQTARDKQARLDAIQQASTELREQLPEGTLIDQKMIDAQMGSGGTWAKRATEMGYEKELFERNVKQIEADQKQKDKILAKLIKDEIITPDTPLDRREALINYNMLDYYRDQAIAKGNTALANELTSRQAAWQEDIEQARIGELPWYKPERIKAAATLPFRKETYAGMGESLKEAQALRQKTLGEWGVTTPADEKKPLGEMLRTGVSWLFSPFTAYGTTQMPKLSPEFAKTVMELSPNLMSAEEFQMLGREKAIEEIKKRLEEYKNTSGGQLLAKQWEQQKEDWKQRLPGGEVYEAYEKEPIQKQVLAELPAYFVAALVLPSATGLRGGALKVTAAKGGVKGAIAETARVALAPIAGWEWAIRLPFRAVGNITNKVITSYINRNATYLAGLARRPATTTGEKILQRILKWHNRWLSQVADDILKARQATGRVRPTTPGVAKKPPSTKDILLLESEMRASTRTMDKVIATVNSGKELTAQSIDALIAKNTPSALVGELTNIITEPIKAPSPTTPAPTTLVAKTKPEMEALIKQGYKFDLDTKTWGKPEIKPIAPTEPTVSLAEMETGTPIEFPETMAMANWSTDIDAIMEAQAIPEVMATNAQKAKIHTLAAEKKWLDKKGKPKQQYRRLAKSMTGKTSSAKMTQDEASQFIEALSKLPEVTLRGKPPTLPIKTKLVPEGLLKRPFSEPSYPAEWFTPQNRYAVKLGVGELTRPIEDAKRGMDVEYYKVKHQIEQLIDQVNKLGGTSVAEKVQAKLKNKPTAAVKQMRDWLDTYEEAPAELTPDQVNVFNWFRALNRNILNRQNEVRAKLGREPIEYRQAYVRHIAGTVAQSILQGNQPYPTELGDWEKINISKKLNNPMEYQRTLEEDLYELFTRDLGFATKSMVRTALREVYLSEPLNNLNEQIGTMSKEMPNYKGLTQAELESVQDIQKMPLSTRSWLIDYINENIKDYPSGFDIKVNRWLTQSGLKGVFDEALKPFGRSLGQMPLTAAGRKIGEAVIFAVLPGRPKILIRNLFQTLQNTGLYGIKATMKGIFPADPSVKELMDKSLFLKNYTGLEEMPAGTLGKIEKAVSKPYRWTAVGNVQRGMRAGYADTMELFTKKEHAWANWASPQRTYTEPEGFLYPDEKERMLREMEYGGGQSAQYDYSKMGMPGIFRHKVLTPLTRLQSWHMNYFWSYWPEMMTRAFKGHVGYDTNLKLPWSKRINALKYLVVGGFILNKMGYKRSFMLGVLPHYMSPAAQFALGLYNYLTADTDWTRLKGEQAMKYSITAIIPGSLAWRDWSAVWKGDKPLESLFFYGIEEGEAEKTPSYLVK